MKLNDFKQDQIFNNKILNILNMYPSIEAQLKKEINVK